jgi:hypothetical protein
MTSSDAAKAYNKYDYSQEASISGIVLVPRRVKVTQGDRVSR